MQTSLPSQFQPSSLISFECKLLKKPCKLFLHLIPNFHRRLFMSHVPLLSLPPNALVKNFSDEVYFDLLKKHVDSSGFQGSANPLPGFDHAELLSSGQRDAGVKGRGSGRFGEVLVALPFPSLLLPRQCPGQFAPHGP